MAGCRKWKNGDVARPFQGHRYLPLMFSTVAGDPAGDDLPPFCDEIPEDLRVFVINVQFLIRAESTHLPSHERLFLPVLWCSFSWPSHSILLFIFRYFSLFSSMVRRSVAITSVRLLLFPSGVCQFR